MSPIVLIATIVAYLSVLFWLARWGDRGRFKQAHWSRHPLVYALALGVYCTTWTFYGLVGTAATRGWNYLPILLGPFLIFTLGFPLLQRIATVCKQESIHSIADFIASRYGKRQSLAIVVTVLMLLATVPYIALQLKAVTDTLLISMDGIHFANQDLTLFIALSMIAFTLFFGANRLDVATYHSGIMVAIAFESLIKLLALGGVALFALTQSQGFDLNEPVNEANRVFLRSTGSLSFWVQTLISAAAIFCLPRMFQVTFVESLGDRHLKYGRFGFSAYLLLVTSAIFLVAWVGNQVLAASQTPADIYVLALPLDSNNSFLALLAFLGGFSAATAMIIVASLTLGQMLTNDVILPILIRTRSARTPVPDYSRVLLHIRRVTVAAIIGLAWLYQRRLGGNIALTDLGLNAFALVVQLAPAVILGLYWHRCNAVGVLWGLGCGAAIWFFTLLVPMMVESGMLAASIMEEGLFGLVLLKPHALLGLSFSEPYTQGVLLSVVANFLAVYIFSTFDRTSLADRIQAMAFVSRARQRTGMHGARITREDLTVLLTQFLGGSATDRLLANHRSPEADLASSELLDFAEQALSGVVGVASARAMLLSLTDGKGLAVEDVVNIFEETTKSLQFSQDMLFASFESISSAISVVNAELKMVAWNRRYEQMFNYPEGMLQVGRPVADLVRFNAQRGFLGAGSVEQHVQTRLSHLIAGKPYRVVRTHNEGVIEIKGRPLPKGGYVTTYDDISEFIFTQNALEQANENLERRVRQRTEEIEAINHSLREEIDKRVEIEEALIQAKAVAEGANADKTHFLAIASHDILQPLNAANLYASAMLERAHLDHDLHQNLKNLHGAIGSAELIISNLLEIARLDKGALKPQVRTFPLSQLLEPLVNEFRVQTDPAVAFEFHPTRLWVESDPKYLRRILQNFLSNAVRYTRHGKILLGCRRRGEFVEIAVYDTGPGFTEAHRQRIFEDFYRINAMVEGAGLGLGIAQRFSRLLNHALKVTSEDNRGSVFSVLVPMRREALEVMRQHPVIALSSGLENLRIFYVDDDANNTDALGELVRNWGCSFVSVCDLEATKKHVSNNSAADMVLMDYQLGPEGTGIELALWIRNFWRGVPVCIVSGATHENLAIMAAEHGFDFLRKPIKPSKLRALLERYARDLNRSGPPTSSPE